MTCWLVCCGSNWCVFSSDVSVEFVEYEPFYFRQIRLSAGVEDSDYIT